MAINIKDINNKNKELKSSEYSHQDISGLQTKTDNDVPKTTITPALPNGIVVASGGAVINYIVKMVGAM